MEQIQAQQSEGLSEHYEQRVMERTLAGGVQGVEEIDVWRNLKN